MNISNQKQSTAFNHLVPTEPLLKAALGIHKFEDAKILNNAIGVNYSGHISFYKRAIKISDNIVKNNPIVAEIVKLLHKYPDLETKMNEIRKIKAIYGDFFDVTI